MGTHHAKFTNYSFDVEEFMRLVVNVGLDVRKRKMAAHPFSVNIHLDNDSETTSGQINVHEEL